MAESRTRANVLLLPAPPAQSSIVRGQGGIRTSGERPGLHSDARPPCATCTDRRLSALTPGIACMNHRPSDSRGPTGMPCKHQPAATPRAAAQHTLRCASAEGTTATTQGAQYQANTGGRMACLRQHMLSDSDDASCPCSRRDEPVADPTRQQIEVQPVADPTRQQNRSVVARHVRQLHGWQALPNLLRQQREGNAKHERPKDQRTRSSQKRGGKLRSIKWFQSMMPDPVVALF